METPEQQRKRLYRKRLAETNDELIKCLECNLAFKRVGSHVVQVHGYENSAEYRKQYGIARKEMTVPSHRLEMKAKARNLENLELGKGTRFVKGGNHGERIKEYWNRRKSNDTK